MTADPYARSAAPATTPSPGAYLDGVDLDALARRVGTPCHVYSATAIRRRIVEMQRAFRRLDSLICYAVKANPNIAVLQLMADSGVGADIVSIGELRRSLQAGVPANRIVFSGVGKTADEIDAALTAGILRFNVESLEELHLLQRLARERHVVAHAAVRINPDVDALTHEKICTGRAENKFGVDLAEARRWFAIGHQLTNVRLDGLHVHIGSQILALDPFRHTLRVVCAFQRELRSAGHEIASIDLGGGIGVGYRAGHDVPLDLAGYAEAVRDALGEFRGRLVFEPGRYLVAEAGVLLTRAIRVKDAAHRRFLVVDAAMNDLPRPSLYDAWHDIVALVDDGRPTGTFDVVGPVCESSDVLGRARELPECVAGDLLMIRTTGAYAASMASTYNSRALAAEVVVEEGRYAVVRRRQTFEELVAGESAARTWQRT